MLPRVDPFYPLSIALLIAMVYVAINPGIEKKRALDLRISEMFASGFMVEGDDFNNADAQPGVTAEYLASASPPSLVGHAATRFVDRGLSVGMTQPVPPEVMAALTDTGIKVTITARAAAVNPAEEFAANVMFFNGSTAAWRTFELTRGYSDYVLEWEPPVIGEGRPGIVAFWPDARGLEQGLEVLRMRIEPLYPARGGD